MFNRRVDGTLCRDVPAYRRIMPYLIRGRNEGAFYFDQEVDLTKTEPFIEKFNAAHPDTKITIFHVVLWAALQTYQQRPRLNRFVAGGKLWQRNGIDVSFSAKKRFDDDSPVFVVKRRFEAGQSLEEIVDYLYSDLKEGRSDKKSHTDKELDLFLKLPGPLLRFVVALERLADAMGLLPRFYIDGDPMFCSIFIANLGSLKMEGGFHHLFEYGNCPIFCVIGQTKDAPVVRDGELAVGRVAHLRWSYDERVEDGLYAQAALEQLRAMVEDPEGAGA
ncbi:MAG: hypothetical protein DCC49_03645 [Acidobacteria bacterium]|nr:MAG: hypothetical protein DCC49_03645 [Acidobacteriota bacterium]